MSEFNKKNLSFETVLQGGFGSRTISDTTEHSGLVSSCFIAQEDSVIDTLTGYDHAGNPVDFKVARNMVNLKAGALHTAGHNCYFETAKLASGSIIIY